MLNSKGQTLLELIVVISVSVIIIGALVFATISSLRNAQFAKNQAQATKLAQEGMERVRAGRDRNQSINNLDDEVVSWNGTSDSGACNEDADVKEDSIWCYPITGREAVIQSGPRIASIPDTKCEVPTSNIKCYFRVDVGGSLTQIRSSASFPETCNDVECIPSNEEPIFKRAMTLSDSQDTYHDQKTVTVIVKWSDFSGLHESKLTTILRKR